MTYELCREIFNQCSNNQMRDVSFEEVELKDTLEYVKKLEPKAYIEADTLSDGTLVYDTDTAGLKKRYSFTPV